MDAGFTLNVKGMLIFEMPGPRILLVMKAKIIWIRPPRKGIRQPRSWPIIDIDLGRGRITIGLTFDYEIKPLLSIHFPFARYSRSTICRISRSTSDLVQRRQRHVLRSIQGPRLFHGPWQRAFPTANTTPATRRTFPLLPLGGFAIATGVSVSFLWGNRSSGLYLSVGASVDVGIGFSPIMFNGELRLWGELHLWVISIEASAQLTVIAGQVPDGPLVPDPEYPGDPTRLYQPTKSIVQIDGEVHGEVDMLLLHDLRIGPCHAGRQAR